MGAAAAAVAVITDRPWTLAVLPAIALAGWLLRPQRRTRDLSAVHEADAEAIQQRAGLVAQRLIRLSASEDLQHGVFEVSSELVGCIEAQDTHQRFCHAMRRYWAAERIDLAIWERGAWFGFGCSLDGSPMPELDGPVHLPGSDAGGDLVVKEKLRSA